MPELDAPLRASGPDGADGADTAATELPPMPRRVTDPSGVALAPDEFVADLLARGGRLVEQLQDDVAGLTAEQQRDQKRIEQEWEQLHAALQVAAAKRSELVAKARAIAEKKARPDILARAMTLSIRLDDSRSFTDIANELESELKLARGITGTIRLPAIGRLLTEAALAIEALEAAAEAKKQRLLSETTRQLQAEGTEARASFDIGLAVMERDLEVLGESLPPSATPWTDPRWSAWTPRHETVDEWLRVGDHHHDDLPGLAIPLLLPANLEAGLVIEPGPHRSAAIAAMQSIVLRILAAHPPGLARFTFVDPKGLGDSVAPLLALGDHEPALIDGGVRTSPGEIEAALDSLARHIERITQQHLQGRFDTLEKFHDATGELVEPRRFVVLVDHPLGLTERADALLATIIEFGPRAGVHTLVVKQTKRGRPQRAARSLAGVPTIRARSDGLYVDSPTGTWRITPDPAPPVGETGTEVPIGSVILREIGSRARTTIRAPLTLGRLFIAVADAHRRGITDTVPDMAEAVDAEAPGSWWKADAVDRVVVPVGRTADREPVTVTLYGSRGPVLFAGRDPSTVDRLIDTYLTALALLYPPTEVQLILLGLGDTGGLQRYGRSALPHARLVADGADREVVMSILKTLVAEIDRRVERFRANDCIRTGLRGYRAASGRELSRIVLALIDIEALVAPPDRLGREAMPLLERLLLEGPPLGIHAVIGQPLRNGTVTALAPVIDLLGDRIVSDIEPADLAVLASPVPTGTVSPAGTDMNDNSDRGLHLPVRGPITPFRVVTMAAQDHVSYLRELRRVADGKDLAGTPQVLDADARPTVEHAPFALLGRGTPPATPRLWLGDPLGLGPPVEVRMPRRRGSNLLVIDDDIDVGLGVVLASLTSAVKGQGDRVAVHLVDGTPIDEGLGDVLAPFERAGSVALARAQSLGRILDAAEKEVRYRVGSGDAAGDGPGRSLFVVVAGLPETASDADMALMQAVARNGPGVGVHLLVWCDTERAVSFGDDLLAEFGCRVVPSLPAGNSARLIESDAAGRLRPGLSLLYEEGRDRLVTFRPYRRPTPGWQPPT
jgi:DNA segregation ATPase FtsK/SpoIIIE, S-DNA-T family